ncbi:MAG TPA: translation initiation factor IF-2 [Thermoprotei archaeon]|nr:translation initiation factor IF-2 [Thermoprotei archaeon]
MKCQTQHIGASFIPSAVIARIAGELMKRYRFSLEFPGLLFIDTPGHEVFMNLRKRGGSIADFAVLVVDAVKGFEPQTDEAVDILVERKTPFLVALNKIDRVPGWVSKTQDDVPPTYEASYARQQEVVKRRLDSIVYSVSGSLGKHGISADLFSRISDFSRTVAIVPVSALTGEGLPELLVLTAGLTQRYMSKKLTAAPKESEKGRGSILEVKEEKGLGTVLDVLLYEGEMAKGDSALASGIEGPLVGKIRNILIPAPLTDTRFQISLVEAERVEAATGVRVVPDEPLKGALPGSPLIIIKNGADEASVKAALSELKEETSVTISSDVNGVVVKADTFGSLEAVISAMKKRGIPVRMANLGMVSKKDVVEASVVKDKDYVHGFVAAFNVRVNPDAESEAETRGISIVKADLIYQLLDLVDEEIKKRTEELRLSELRGINRPVEIKLLPEYVFRRASPIIVGIRVVGGTLKPQRTLIDENGEKVGEVLQLQDKGKVLDGASEGSEVAMSLKTSYTLGRQIKENATLFGDMAEDEAVKLYTKYRSDLSQGEVNALLDLVKVKRRKDPSWGMLIA